MSDLVHSRFPIENPLWSLFGQQNNITQSDIPAFTNLQPGVGGLIESGAPIITKEETTFPVWIPSGTTIEKISLVNTATETEVLTHAWCAVRSAPALAVGGEFKPVLQVQSKDNTSFEAKKTETVSFTLEKPITVTSAIAPYGFIYLSIYMVATKVGTYACFKTPATALTKAPSSLKVYPWFANAPITSKSKPAESGTAEKEPKEVALVETVPFVLVQ